jgi:hypothetical protein
MVTDRFSCWFILLITQSSIIHVCNMKMYNFVKYCNILVTCFCVDRCPLCLVLTFWCLIIGTIPLHQCISQPGVQGMFCMPNFWKAHPILTNSNMDKLEHWRTWTCAPSFGQVHTLKCHFWLILWVSMWQLVKRCWPSRAHKVVSIGRTDGCTHMHAWRNTWTLNFLYPPSRGYTRIGNEKNWSIFATFRTRRRMSTNTAMDVAW